MYKDIFGMAAEIVDKKLYFSCQFDNALYEVDLVTNEIHFKKYFLKEKSERTLFCRAYQYEKKIVFIPWVGKHIAVYDTVTETINYIDMPIESNKFESIRVGDSILFISIEGSDIYKYDVKNGSIEYINTDNKDSLNYKHRRCEIYGKDIIFLPGKDMKFYYLDIATKRIQSKQELFDTGKYSFYKKWKNKEIYIPFYVDEGIIIQDDDETYRGVKIKSNAKRVGSVTSIIIDNDILIFPTYGYKLYRINILTGDVQELDLKREFNLNWDDWGFQNVIKDGNNYYISSDRVPVILKINANNSEDVSIISLKYKADDIYYRIKEVIENGSQVDRLDDDMKIMYEGYYKLEDLFTKMFMH